MNFEQDRENLLATARAELTDKAKLDIGPDSEAITLELGDFDNEVGYKKMCEDLEKVMKQALPADYSPTMETQQESLDIARIYFRLGEILAPFYAAVADWIHGKIEASPNSVIVFEGRDSLGFLMAYTQRYGKENIQWIYSPMSRAAVQSHYTEEMYDGQTELEQNRVADFYQRKDLAGKKVYFFDFGFRGTLPRLEQLILEYKKMPKPESIDILLVADKPDKPLLTKGQLIRQGAFQGGDMPTLDSLDLENSKKIKGFFSEGKVKGTTLDFESMENDNLNDFLMTLQELSSYIKESREDALASQSERMPHKTSLNTTSMQVLTAKFAFLKGLQGSQLKELQTSTETAFEKVNLLFRYYKKYPKIFNLMKDLNWNIGTYPEFKNLIDKLNTQLLSQGMNRLIT